MSKITKNRIHLFCPNQWTTEGTFQNSEILWDEVVKIVADPSSDIAWRCSWTSIRDMLLRAKEITKERLPAEGQSRRVISREPNMLVGESGILFRGLGPIDFKGFQTPIDFQFFVIKRIK
jgi:gentisate 1,2-dioxygenase